MVPLTIMVDVIRGGKKGARVLSMTPMTFGIPATAYKSFLIKLSDATPDVC